jgi:hypothetical protein
MTPQVWITYQPSLPQAEVSQLQSFVKKQSVLSPGGAPGSRYMDLTPYPGECTGGTGTPAAT